MNNLKAYIEKKDSKSYTFIVSSEAIDRTGDIVKVDGIDYKNYMKNPVVLFQHERSGKNGTYPIGKTKRMWKENGKLKAEVELHEDTETARTVKGLIDKGMLNAASIGFRGVKREFKDVDGQQIRIFTKSELLEWSIVDVPANQDAIREKNYLMYDSTGDEQSFEKYLYYLGIATRNFYSSQRIPCTKTLEFLNKEGIITGRTYESISRTLTSSSFTSGGALLPPEFLPALEAERNASVVRQAGARVHNVKSGAAWMPKISTGTNAYWRADGQAPTRSELTTGTVNFDLKKLLIESAVSNEFINRAYDYDVATVIKNDIMAAFRESEDYAFLMGSGAESQPKGIVNRAGTSNAITGSDESHIKADLKTAVRGVSGNIKMVKPGWVMSNRSRDYILATVDTYYDQLSNGKLWGYPVYITANIPDNLGTGSNESVIVFADFDKIHIGQDPNTKLEFIPNSGYGEGVNFVSGVSRDFSTFRGITSVDLNTKTTNSISTITGVTWGA